MSGRNNSGKIIIRHRSTIFKKNYYLVDFCRRDISKIGFCINICKDSSRTAFISLIKYSNGSFNYILSSQGFRPGMYTYFLFKPKVFSYGYITNCVVLMKYLPLNTLIFNVEIKEGYNFKLARSAGTFCKVISFIEEKGLTKISIPSGKIIYIIEDCSAHLGRASNIFHRNQFLCKAGYNRIKGFRPTVRGVAMNPVDHPHGGRTKTSSPEFTPWGKVAKYNR